MNKVSIIIPVYNAERYLEACLDSALNQTHKEIEIIAVDDGSSDTSPSILRKYANQIRMIRKDQGGVASARNAGIKIASGEWIKLLDNDDVLYPEAIADLLNETGKIDTHLKILYANVDFINERGNLIGHLTEPNYNHLDEFDSNVILLDHNIGIPSTWLIHRSTLDHCGLFDEKTEHDDYEYHLRACILHNCRFHLVEKNIAQYRIHSQQFTWQVMRKYKSQDEIVKKVLDKLDKSKREKYLNALMLYRKNRSFFEKTSHFFKPLLKFMPIKMEIWLRTIYSRLSESRKAKKGS